MATARDRLVSRKEAASWARRSQRRGERVVFTSGCFDLLHVGHVRSLEEAASFGDRLIVGVNSDASVRKLKGKGRPIVSARQRAEMLAALHCVDRVLIFSGATPRATLAALKPDVYAKGGDWPLAVLREKDVPPDLDLEVRRLRQIPGVRTTEIVKRARRSR
jgi:rfaE bifunctional protein nucleotidyltransferase chain/domain